MAEPGVLSAAEAIERFVRPGDRVLLGTGAGAARTLQSALVSHADRLEDLRLVGGLQLGDYAFMEPVRAGRWRYDTWHVTSPISRDVDAARVGVHLCRGGLVPDLIRQLAPDVFLTTVSPPDPRGMVSFGASVSYALPMARHVRRVVAEVNPAMPAMCGSTRLHMSAFDALVDAEEPLDTYVSRPPTEIDRRIAAHVAGLIPPNATLQGGLGGVPEALIQLLGDDPPEGLRMFGMGTDGMIPFLEKTDRPGAFVGGELLGTARLYSFAHDNPAMEHYPISEILRVPALARIPRLVSLNGAIEVDLTGQVNAEWVGGRQISGAGGSFDFVDGTWFSEGGVSVIALHSTALDGSVSTIVSRLGAGTPVATPRHSVRFIVTEFGVADLWGLTIRERREALIAVAHPDFRNALESGAA
jgi:4-hydroxybutyrate CoA-transferase